MGKTALRVSAPIVVALLSPIALIPFPPQFYFAIALVAIPIVLFFTAVIAFPLYHFIPKKLRTNSMVMSGFAFLAGAISYMLFQFLIQPGYSRIGDVVYVADGAFTLAGWVRALTAAAIVGMISIPGGLLFCRATQHDGPDKSLAHNP